MQSIFFYTDYREFLRDHYNDRKTQNHAYSFRHFAKKAGLNSPNYYKLVMDGQRNLTHRNIRKFVKGLGLPEREALYFENLILSNQAKDEEEKKFYVKNLELIRSQGEKAVLAKDQYEVLTNWWPMAIREAIQLPNFQPQPKWIASRFDYRFSPQQAREAIELLTRMKLIEEDPKTGKLRPKDISMEMPNTHSDVLRRHHKLFLDLAKEALDQQPATDRHHTALTVAIRKSDLPKAMEKIRRFLREMDTFLTTNRPPDSVYQLNVQLFRMDEDV